MPKLAETLAPPYQGLLTTHGSVVHEVPEARVRKGATDAGEALCGAWCYRPMEKDVIYRGCQKCAARRDALERRGFRA